MILPLVGLAYVVRTEVSILVAHGATPAAQTAAAKAYDGPLDPWRVGWVATSTKPTGYAAPSSEAVRAAFDGATLSVSSRQFGFVRLPYAASAGDPNLPVSLRYVVRETVYPCPDLAAGQAVVEAVYGIGRRVTYPEYASLTTGGGQLADVTELRAKLTPLPWAAMDAMGTVRVSVRSTPPPMPAAPYDAAVVVP